MIYCLEQIYSELAANVSRLHPDNDEFLFSERSLAISPDCIETGQVIIKKSRHVYNPPFRTDMLIFHAHQDTYQCLALLTLSAIFHSSPARVHVQLTHPDSDIKHLIIDFKYFDGRDSRYPGYSTLPYQFHYVPRQMARHPWCMEHPDPKDLPCLWLTNMDELVSDEVQWEARDTVVGFGTDVGSIRFADLLLNAGNVHNDENEYVLEGDAGFRGVGPLSAEVSLLLPGSSGWRAEYWNTK